MSKKSCVKKSLKTTQNYWADLVSKLTDSELVSKYQEKLEDYKNSVDETYKGVVSDVLRHFKKEAMKRNLDLLAF